MGTWEHPHRRRGRGREYRRWGKGRTFEMKIHKMSKKKKIKKEIPYLKTF